MEEAILMTSTGGRQNYDGMYNANGIGNHDFSRLDAAIDRLIPSAITPTIVIGNVPTDISDRPADLGDFDANIGAPADYNSWTLYHDYIQALFSHLQTRYGTAAIPPSRWEYRLMTEPDNVGWFDPYNMGAGENCHPYNLTKYMRIYDETIDAIRIGLGNNGIALNPGNMMITPYLQPGRPSWVPDMAYMLNNDGYPVTRFCVSLYGNIGGDGTNHIGGCQMNADPRELKSFISNIRSKINPYYPNASISTEEGELYIDENWRLFGFSGSNLGSAYLAGLLKNGYDVNLNRYTLWQLTANGLKAPAYNVVEMYKKMREQKRIRLDVPATSYPYIDGISSKSNVRVSTMVFSYFPSHASTKTNSVTVKFSGFRKNGRYILKTYLVDKTRSNYFDEFYTDIGVTTRQGIRNLMTESGSDKVSEYYPDVVQYMNAATRQTWNNNLQRYRDLSGLERIEKTIVKTDANGLFSKSISLAVNSVYLFEIENCDNVELY